MKLQACSKIITLAIMGLTLTASGAFYALQQAEQSLLDDVHAETAFKKTALAQELQQYSHLINAGHYQLLNSSLQQLLSLREDQIQKDPLLSFYENNIRNGLVFSHGKKSKTIPQAIESLQYFNIPYLSFDFEVNDLQIHNVEADELKTRLLSCKDDKGRKLTTLIKEKPSCTQDFTIFYAGNDTWLALQLYDEKKQKNYYILSRYSKVLKNVEIGINSIFPNVGLMMHDLLGDRAAMIVRHGQVLFKTEDFSLDLDTKTLDLSRFQEVQVVDTKGQSLEQPETAQDKHFLAASYLKSTDSWLLLQSPYTGANPDVTLYKTSRYLILFFTLLTAGALCLLQYYRTKSYESEREEQKKDLDQLSEKFTKLNFTDFKAALSQANQEAHGILLAKAEEKLKVMVEQEEERRRQQEEAEEEARRKAEASIPVQPSMTEGDAQQSQAVPPQNAQAHDQMQAQDQQPAQPAQGPVLEGQVHEAEGSALPVQAAQPSHELVPTEKQEKVPVVLPQQAEDLIDEQELFELTDKLLLQHFLGKTEDQFKDLDATNLFAHEMVAHSLKLSHALHKESIDTTNKTLEDHVEQIKTELKNRIALYRKEGQCLAARQMLLSALPAEDAMPTSNFVDFAAFTVPARELTGNFYTLKRLDEENLAFVIGDTDATGVKAAYTAAVTHTLVEEALKMAMSPWDILSWINQRLYSMPHVAHVSMFIGIVSERTGNVIGANAGHCVPLVIDNDGPRFVDDYRNPMLGLELQAGFHPVKWYLANNDMVMLYSKGILNVQNSEKEIFGMPRLLEHCNSNVSADELVIKILNDIKLHKGRKAFKQDVSLICLKQLLIRF